MARNNTVGLKLAEDLRIGDRLGEGRDGQAIYVKRLHELCMRTPGPHVHIVSNSGEQCRPFRQPVK